MSLDNDPNLKEYIRACTLLDDDLRWAIEDLDYKLKPDHKIHYAVDFSELYEFILPSEAYRDFVLFPEAFEDDEVEKTSARAIQQIILRYILLELDPKQIILLPPYLVEFANFINKYHNDMFIDFITNANMLYEQFREITSNNLVNELENIGRKAQKTELSNDEDEKLNAFLGKYGQFQSIIEHIDSQNSPWKRLNLLDVQHSFIKLDPSLLQMEEGKDPDVYTRWVRKFDKLRRVKSATSKIDAMAIQILFDINRVWKQNHRLVLISRSKYMHAIYRHEFEKKRWNWDETGNYYLLRHPRAFSLVLPATLPDSPYNRDDLVKFRKMIEHFLVHCKSCQPDDPQTREDLRKEIHEIEKVWRRFQQYVITYGTSAFPRAETKTKIAKKAQIIMDVIRNQFYKGKLVEYVKNLFVELDQTHEYLRLSLQGLPDQLRDINVQVNHHGLMAISLNALFMPFRLYLESDSVSERIRTISSQEGVTTRDFIAFLRQSHEYDNYENYLANAYLLGVLGWWHFAETYCRMAFTKECQSDDLRNEGKYFLAVCIAQQEASLDRLMEAYHLLEEIPNKPEISRYDRYQLEKGVLILKLNIQRTKVEKDIPSATVGLYLLNSLPNVIQNNASLWLSVLKVKLDYFYSQRDKKNFLNLKQEWDELENALIRIEPDSGNWPPVIVDAVVWGKWLLFADEFKLKQERQALILMLKNALKMAPSDLEIHNEIKFHIKEIQKRM